MKRSQVISKRGGRLSKAQLKATYLTDPAMEPVSRATYLTVSDVRVYLRLRSNWSVYRWVRAVGLPKCRIGRSLRFLRRDVDEAVQGPQERQAAHARSIA